MTLSTLLPSRGVEWGLFPPPAKNLKSKKVVFLEILGWSSRATIFFHTGEIGVVLGVLRVVVEKHKKDSNGSLI